MCVQQSVYARVCVYILGGTHCTLAGLQNETDWENVGSLRGFFKTPGNTVWNTLDM